MLDILSNLIHSSSIFIIALVLAIGYFWYAAIIKRRNTVLEALSGIDVQLTQRHDLIPNILTLAKAFMTHERELLEGITALRAQAQSGIGARSADDVAKHIATENQLATRMGQFFAVSENYPQLKADNTMLEAQKTYRNVEDNIAAARRFYNSAVTALNNSIQVPPGNFFAAIAGIKAYPFYEASIEQKAPVNASDFFKA